MSYTDHELTEALRAINSVIYKCEKAQEEFSEGSPHHILLRNQLKAMYISKALIEEQLTCLVSSAILPSDGKGSNPDSLLANLERLHTTELGAQRICKNLHLDTDDVVAWCKEKIKAANSNITRKGKNWYITAEGCTITVNVTCYTIITAHRNT